MIAIALMIALLFYAFLAWAVVRFVGWLGRICTLTPVTTKASQAFCASVFVLLPTWDIIPGWIYFTHLCDSQAEVKILRTVDLAEKYFLPNGQVDGQKVGDKFKGLFSSDKEFSPLLHIEKRESVLQDSITGEMLGVRGNLSIVEVGLLDSSCPMEGTCAVNINSQVRISFFGVK